MFNAKNILLLEVGGEGGSLRLELEMTDAGIFSYRLLDDSSEGVLYQKEEFKQPVLNFSDTVTSLTTSKPLVIDWDRALQLLDNHRWPWITLYPLFVHPAIRLYVITAIKQRFQHYPEIDLCAWEREFVFK